MLGWAVVAWTYLVQMRDTSLARHFQTELCNLFKIWILSRIKSCGLAGWLLHKLS